MQNEFNKICHLTSVHSRYDTRIFIKMCSSLAKVPEYEVYLIVADGKGDEIKNCVNIVDIGPKTGSRLNRITKIVNKVSKKAVELNADIYHLHDPELIRIGLKLKKMGKKVIFDAHEDLPKQLLTKPYLNKPLRWILSKILSIYENYACKKFDYIIAATPSIRDKFLKISKNTVDISNFPLLDELYLENSWENKKDEVCYIGGITIIRGIREIIKAFEYIENIKLNLAGEFENKELEDEIKQYKGWEKVNYFGFVGRDKIIEILDRSKTGLVTLHPTINYIESQPVKMFEYMSAGIPVIASNFPLWKEIIEKNNCGICVDPLNPMEIADAIKYIIEHPEEAKKMGENGRKAVIEKYNWDIEEKKLYKIYNRLILLS